MNELKRANLRSLCTFPHQLRLTFLKPLYRSPALRALGPGTKGRRDSKSQRGHLYALGETDRQGHTETGRHGSKETESMAI